VERLPVEAFAFPFVGRADDHDDGVCVSGGVDRAVDEIVRGPRP
jgi:hypothetical protein